MRTTVLGIAGGRSGQDALLIRLLPLFTERELRVATVKHAHHDCDVDTPGKDSFEHRRAGASEVIISSARRWAQMHELVDEPEPTLGELLQRISPCDLILIEGFKTSPHPKLEVFRSALGKPALYRDDPQVLGVATDSPLSAPPPVSVDLNDSHAVAECVLNLAQPLRNVLATLAAR